MLATDEDALICDFAETYHILDIRALDLRLAATLAAGLAPDSRIRRKLSGQTVQNNTLLLAAAADNLAVIRWFMSEDGQRGVNRPQSFLQGLLGEGPQDGDPDIMIFNSPEAFEAARAKILEGVKNHGD